MQHKIVIAILGSLGDLHPFLALGRALASRNVRVLLAGAAEYREKTERAGLEFHPMSPSFAQLERLQGEREAAFVRAMLLDREFILREIVIPHARSAYEDLLPVVAGADCVVVSSLAFGARFAAERQGVPWVPITLQPFMFVSAYDPPAIPEAPRLSALLPHLPRPLRAALLALVKRATRPLIEPLEALRVELGLARGARATLFEDTFRPAGTIALYSPILGAVEPDFPAGTVIAGFAPFDSEDGGSIELEPELESFLEAGAPPWVFTLGSVLVREPGNFFRESCAAARACGRRAVLLVGAQGLETARAELAASDVFVGAYAPYSLLFPRAAVVVHHGGIGTLGQALRAGRPQLIVPHFVDQPDNAARAARLGVARVLSPAHYRRDRVMRALGALESEPATARRVGAARAALLEEDGAAAAAGLILARLQERTLREADEIV
ncbi:MAG TPA: glycosyltransferase [Steroidobacteraceae bacterium]|nr:glycosyltransferase [Steroidobacteraceae bacterium]